MELSAFFAAVGGDYRAVLDRLPSDDMILRFLRKFTRDPAYGDLKAALAAEDLETAFRAAHTLKGTAATLGLEDLSAAASRLTEALRGASGMPETGLVTAVDQVYQRTVELIGGLDG